MTIKKDEPAQPAQAMAMPYLASKGMRDMMGPFLVDQTIRQAITHCWMMLPETQRNYQTVEQEIQRLVQRALDDFKQDVTAFDFAAPE
jgi:hypothetical protein